MNTWSYLNNYKIEKISANGEKSNINCCGPVSLGAALLKLSQVSGGLGARPAAGQTVYGSLSLKCAKLVALDCVEVAAQAKGLITFFSCLT